MTSLPKILCIIGARPQFIKHYPFELAAKNHLDLITIHTGQHYDEYMSKVFFDQLGMSWPDHQLSLGGGSHGEQTGKMLIEIEQIIKNEDPDAVLVYGDTNSTLAGSLAASKLHVPCIHVEAGLRSYNKRMPEEINRIMTDHVSDLLLVPSQTAVDNLKKEGIESGVHIVGDIMKDLVMHCVESNLLSIPAIESPYYYMTLHRPYNVDNPERLRYVLDNLSGLEKQVVFAAHPRTQNKLKEMGEDLPQVQNIKIIDPQPYLENLSWLNHADALITDSGGMQKEAYWLQKKCITIRSETEWIETLEGDWNKLLFEDLSGLSEALQRIPAAWDSGLYGNAEAGKKMVELIKSKFTS